VPRKLSIISLFFLGVLISRTVESYSSVSQNPKIVRVPANFATIQKAVDAVSPGDTILVASGVYSENIAVTKTLRLIGEDRNTTVIDGGGAGWEPLTIALNVSADNVLVENFTIKNANFAVHVNKAFNVTVQSNIISSNFHGLQMLNCSQCIVRNNLFTQNWGGYPDLLYGGGIILEGSECVIERNYVSCNLRGIVLEEGSYNVVRNNTVTESRVHLDTGIYRDGLGIEIFGSRNVICYNVITENPQGIFVGEGATNNMVFKNVVKDNNGLGIGMGHSKMNAFLGNTVDGNDMGFAMELAGDILLSNFISNNKDGIVIHFSNDSIFHHNNFVNNTVDVPEDVYANFNIWDDGFEGNYWDSYNGTDADQDGIGDAPHIIDQYNRDNHPLTGVFSNFTVPWQEQEHFIATVSNSTVTSFQFDSTRRIVSFNVNGEPHTIGFCRVTIPNIIREEMWNNNFTVLVDNKEPLTIRNWTDGTNTFIYFTYQHSQHEVTIIHEYVLNMLLLLFVLTTSLIIIKKRTSNKSPSHVHVP